MTRQAQRFLNALVTRQTQRFLNVLDEYGPRSIKVRIAFVLQDGSHESVELNFVRLVIIMQQHFTLVEEDFFMDCLLINNAGYSEPVNGWQAQFHRKIWRILKIENYIRRSDRRRPMSIWVNWIQHMPSGRSG